MDEAEVSRSPRRTAPPTWTARARTDAGGQASPQPADESRRRDVSRPTIALVALAVFASFVGAAAAYSLLLQPKVYGGQADFLITISPALSDAAADRVMLTQVEMVTSPTVLQPVAAEAGSQLRELEDAVSADMLGRTNILRITVADRDAGRAVRLSELVAAEYGEKAATLGPTTEEPPQFVVTPLTPAGPTDTLVAPQPLRALAAGTLLGLLGAAATVVILWRPWRLTRLAPFWR